MWNAGETFAIEIGLTNQFSGWQEILKEKGYKNPVVNYTVCNGQRIKFQIFDQFISDPKTKCFEVNCEWDSARSAVKDCDKGFRKAFGLEDKRDENKVE